MKVTLTPENKKALNSVFNNDITEVLEEYMIFGAKYSTDDLTEDEIEDIEQEIQKQGNVLAAQYLITKLEKFIKINQA